MDVIKKQEEGHESYVYLDKKYALLTQIGEGGFGRILLARDTIGKKL